MCQAGPSLLTHRWHLLITFALAIPAQTWAQADTSKRAEQPEAAQAFTQGNLLDTFGKWEIRTGLGGNSYLLIGKSAGDGESQFWLHCDQHKLITVCRAVDGALWIGSITFAQNHHTLRYWTRA